MEAHISQQAFYWVPLTSITGAQHALCPDLLRYEQIGEADGLRGWIVRTFFWLLRIWPPRAQTFRYAVSLSTSATTKNVPTITFSSAGLPGSVGLP